MHLVAPSQRRQCVLVAMLDIANLSFAAGCFSAAAIVISSVFFLLAKRLWFPHMHLWRVTRAGPPLATGSPQMQPWTLTFTDDADERSYTEQAFRASCQICILSGVVAVVHNAMLAFSNPGLLRMYIGSSTAYFVFIAARLRLDRMHDQQRARILYGRVIVALGLARFAITIPWLHFRSPKPGPVGTLAVSSLLWFMAPIYMRISALDPAHRLAILALSFVGILAVPPITTLGRPLEPLWACCVLVLGEAVGYLIERRMRLSHGNRQGQQLASAVPGINQCEAEAPSEMTPTFRSMPWTLTFTDHALERS